MITGTLIISIKRELRVLSRCNFKIKGILLNIDVCKIDKKNVTEIVFWGIYNQ